MQQTDVIVAPQLAYTPFLEFNDGNRAQMAASQCRQAVPLVNKEAPFVCTTFESLDTLLEPEIIRAKQSGKVIYKSSSLLVVQYEDGNYDYFHLDHMLRSKLKTKQDFNKDDILVMKYDYFTDDGILAQGRNLLTAIMSHPYAYEDAIVVSSDVVEKGLLDCITYETIEVFLNPSQVLLSISDKEYKPFPDVGDKIKAFQPVLLVKNIYKSDAMLFNPPKPYFFTKDVEVVDVEVVPGSEWCQQSREFDIKVREIIFNRTRRKKELEKQDLPDKIKRLIINSEFLFDYSSGKIRFKKEPFKKNIYVKITVRKIEPLVIGDKLSNRFANKGVISKIEDAENMPVLPDGRRVEIILNPMSIISRMNIGQLFEIAANNLLEALHQRIQESSNEEETKDLITKFYEIIDNSKTGFISKQIKEYLQDKTLDQIKQDKFVFPAPPFEGCKLKSLRESAKLLNSTLDKRKIIYHGNEYEITCGYMYFYRLVHFAKSKMAARGIGLHSRKTLQPVSGRKKQGGQRLGEMEVWCLLAHNVKENLREMLTIKSDDIIGKMSHIISTIYDVDTPIPRNITNLESVKLLEAYLRVLHTSLNFEEKDRKED